MPVSIHVQITSCVNKIIGVQPKSVLDVGCGYGKWGYLCREYLDAFYGRFRPEDWSVRIDGVEFFEPYIQNHQRALYSNIIIGDIRDLCESLDEYDLIIAGDVIEHMHKDEAERVVEMLHAKAKEMLIINIPLGEGWDHPEQYGNPAELHRSEWYVEDFLGYASTYNEYELNGGLMYGSFYCPKDYSPADRMTGFITAAEFYSDRGDITGAERYAHRAFALEPNSPEAMCMLVDCQIKQGNLTGALQTLQGVIDANPTGGLARIYLAQLIYAQGQKEEACQQLQEGVEMDGLEQELKAQMEQMLAAWA